MNLLGTLYAVDDEHIDIIRRDLSLVPPPSMGGRIICMDMDESDNSLEQQFPDHCIKATLLCPPPIAMYKEIDGDQEGFIEAYNEYLDYENSVQEFIANMLFFMHIGGNILLKTPASLNEDTLWMNILIIYFFTRYGIVIGTSAEKVYNYDQNYDNKIADVLYTHRLTDVFDYINSTTYDYMALPFESYNQVTSDLSSFSGPDINPAQAFMDIRNSLKYAGIPILRPAVMFG